MAVKSIDCLTHFLLPEDMDSPGPPAVEEVANVTQFKHENTIPIVLSQ